MGVGLCAPILLRPADHDLWRATRSRRRYWQPTDRGRIAIAGNEIHALHTTGHTPGSVSLHVPAIGALLTGDAVHAPGVGEHSRLAPSRSVCSRNSRNPLRFIPVTANASRSRRSLPRWSTSKPDKPTVSAPMCSGPPTHLQRTARFC
ncbi:MBL fold metallo-hydrolase [Nocardia sp. NPDC004123]